MMKLAEASVTLVANGSTTQDFLRFFGRCFVRYFSHYGYEKFIKVSGDDFILFFTVINLMKIIVGVENDISSRRLPLSAIRSQS